MKNTTASVIEAASRLASRYLETLEDRAVAPQRAAVEGLSRFESLLPDEGVDPHRIIEELGAFGSPAAMATSGGRFFGLVVGGALPAPLGARILASAWDQIVFNDAISPVGCHLERLAGQWLLDLLALPQDAHVTFTTGATMGNFTCLAAAREALTARAGYDIAAQGLRNAPPLRIVASEEIHVTVIKALMLLGWGKREIEFVPTDAQGALRPDALPMLDDRTIVCVQAGNVNSGACDPFDAVCAAAEKTGAWVHVDGAFGLWAAASEKRRYLVQGLERASSWVTDGHKWLNTPYDCGMAVVRDAQPLHRAMATQAPYLKIGERVAPKDMGPEFSRSARGVEIWAALRSLGRSGVADLVERCCAHACRLSEGLKRLGYEILNDVVLNQVVAAIGTPEEHDRIAAHVQASGECWFGQTVWKGRSAIRLSVANWSTTDADIDRALNAIAEATKKTIR